MGQCASCAAPPRADDAVDDDLGGVESLGGARRRSFTPQAIPAGGAQHRQRQRLKSQKAVDKNTSRGGGGGEAEHASDGGGAPGRGRSSRGFLSRRDTRPLPTSSGNAKKAVALERRNIWEQDNFFGARSGTGGGRVGGGGGGENGGGLVGDGEGGDAPPLTLLEASARRVARHYQASRGGGDQERIYAKLRSFAKTMPQRCGAASSSSSTSSNQKSTGLDTPVAPRVLAEAAEAAMHGCDNEWARRDAVADLLAVDIVYNTMDGKRVLGKEAVIDKMNETMEKMTKRLRRSSARGDGKNMRHLKMRSEGPTYAGSGVWLMSYTFEMMLMKIRVREEFVMDDRGKIKELTRIRM